MDTNSFQRIPPKTNKKVTQTPGPWDGNGVGYDNLKAQIAVASSREPHEEDGL